MFPPPSTVTAEWAQDQHDNADQSGRRHLEDPAVARVGDVERILGVRCDVLRVVEWYAELHCDGLDDPAGRDLADAVVPRVGDVDIVL
jgi:hypothetical protein